MTILSQLGKGLRFMRGNVLVMTLTQTTGMFARSMAFPYASLFVLSLGGQPKDIGLINALSPIAGLIAFPIGGYLADRAGRVKWIALANLFSGLLYLLFILAPNWEMIAVASFLRGFSVFQFPASSAMLADSLAPRDRGRGIATMNTLAGLLAMASPYIAGTLIDALGETLGMRYLYGILMAVSLVNALISWRFLEETAQPSLTRIGLADLPLVLKETYSGIPELLRRLSPPLVALALVIIACFTVNAIAGPFWVVYAVRHLGLSKAQWGLILTIETMTRNLTLIPAGMLADRYGRTKCLTGALTGLLILVPSFVLAKGFGAILAIRIGTGVANALLSPACSALMADMIPREMRGRVMAALGRGSLLWGATSGGTGGPGVGYLTTIPLMVASLAGGYLYSWKPTSPWAFAFFGLLISLILVLRYVRDPQKAEV